jgi:cation diffusion facilitator CzcD-associated flavoprotein CzcO
VSIEHFDVLIVGAGISGIGAGYHLQAHCPGKSYVVLEGRRDIGGTWDLFRYPGIRSDSDMFTLGYHFRPWKAAKAIADGPAILEYLRDTAREFGVDRHIRFQHRVKTAAWSSEESQWTVDAEIGEDKQPVRYTCNFLYLCSGYYDYEKGHAPEFVGTGDFEGQVIHPQHWPKDLDYRDKRVVVIGSGATAVTLVPAMAETAAHVTMLQRSPTYIVSLPSEDRIGRLIRWVLPERTAHRALRWRNVLLGIYFYQICRRTPRLAKWLLHRGVVKQLPPDFDAHTHFQPKYQPWDQRVCLVPDADLFQAICAGQVSVVTDQISHFTKHGIALKSGKELPADIIVTATGLKMLACGGVKLSVDGAPVEPGSAMTYKGVMLSHVPNCAMCVGYTTASWTLRADLSSAYVCRLLNHMDRHGYTKCVPCPNDPEIRSEPLLGLTSGYVQRGSAQFPKQGSKSPWVLRQNYVRDLMMMRYGAIDDGAMVFSKGGQTAATSAAPILDAEKTQAASVSA